MKKYKNDTETLAHIARDFFKLHSVIRYRMKKISDMSDKEIISACHSWCEENGLIDKYKNFEKVYCPDWYWYYGLHDAEISEINELQLLPDYKSKTPKYNCLEIALDCRGALYETNITKINLYNYKIILGNLPSNTEKKIWWIGDTLTVNHAKKYILNLKLENASGKRIDLEIKFEDASIESK